MISNWCRSLMCIRLWAPVVHVQVNKPYLPLASGEYSLATGIAIVVTFAAVVCMSTLCTLFTIPAQQDLIDILLLGCKSPSCHANLLNRGLLAVCSGILFSDSR